MESIAKVGVIGCGNVSRHYFSAIPRLSSFEFVACADIQQEAAEEVAAKWNVPQVLPVDELLVSPDVDAILNLTIPSAHFDVSLAGLEAGKHVYCEKPLALSFDEGRKLVSLADAKGLRIGCAPDTFLGGGLQTARKALDDGLIGQPIGATAFLMIRGHEYWHPSPDFYYKPGGGPMFDMGPYYLTALVAMLGPVRQVTGMTQITWPTRTVHSGPRAGAEIKVEVPTHVSGMLAFESGAAASIITTFDVQASGLPFIEIYGETGTLSLPDPNKFGGTTRVGRTRDGEWDDLVVTHDYVEQTRGLGLADMMDAIANDRPHRANGDLALHVLEIMEKIHTSSEQGEHMQMSSTCVRPEALPARALA